MKALHEFASLRRLQSEALQESAGEVELPAIAYFENQSDTSFLHVESFKFAAKLKNRLNRHAVCSRLTGRSGRWRKREQRRRPVRFHVVPLAISTATRCYHSTLDQSKTRTAHKVDPAPE